MGSGVGMVGGVGGQGGVGGGEKNDMPERIYHETLAISAHLNPDIHLAHSGRCNGSSWPIARHRQNTSNYLTTEILTGSEECCLLL